MLGGKTKKEIEKKKKRKEPGWGWIGRKRGDEAPFISIYFSWRGPKGEMAVGAAAAREEVLYEG
jgi:hypothetical protein